MTKPVVEIHGNKRPDSRGGFDSEEIPGYASALVGLLTRERSDGTSHFDSDMMTPRRARVWSVLAPGPGELPEPCPPWLWPLLLLRRLGGCVSHFSDMSSQDPFNPEVLVYKEMPKFLACASVAW